jgi:serine/threonine protein kinase/formylglycine-generating enzyme required for sulfatase activity/lysophospholipase L1-like esterase/DNA-directed RNA polymerase subunit RPC12/RpoP
MIPFACGRCGKKIQVKDELAGRQGKCPGCGQLVVVPHAAATPAGPAWARPAGVDEERISPEEPSAASEDNTVGPRVEAGRESRSDAGGQTGLGIGRKGEATEAPTPEGAARELYDFLAPAQQHDEIGRLGGYRVLKVLGAGGMGVVFQAEDPRLERNVALKAMLPALAASETARQRFLREAKTAAAIEHDHIVPIFQVGEDRGVPFIAMPFLKGEPLDERLKRDKALTIAEVLRIGQEAAEGLAAAHEKGLVHRDIKPANLWLEAPKGRVKILDFGLARAAADNAQLTQQGAIIGTPAYMAPEQAAGTPVDGRCDLFSLGCVLYRLATGQLPFKGNDTVSTLVAVATENPRPPGELRPELPARLSELILQLLAKKPEGRPASAKVVAEALRDTQEHATASTACPAPRSAQRKAGDTNRAHVARTPSQRPAKKRLPWPWLVGGGALGLGVLLAALVLFWQTPHGSVRIESDDPRVEFVFDKTGPTIKGADKEPITLQAGEHGLLVKRGDFMFQTDKLLIERGKTITLKVELLPGRMQVRQDGKVIGWKDWRPQRPAVSPVAGPLPKTFKNSLGMDFVLVPRGRAWLGGSAGKPGTQQVEVRQDFYLGTYEVTQEQWQAVMGTNPSYFSRNGAGKNAVTDLADADLKRLPVEYVTWNDTQFFLEELNKREKESRWVYRLPKDLEWEYACRGGPMTDPSESAFDFYLDRPTNQLLAGEANIDTAKGLKRPCKVGSYKPNRLGLYDMHGNVWEWCDEELSKGGKPLRLRRGGCWNSDETVKPNPAKPSSCRAANRITSWADWRGNCHGLRVARVPVGVVLVRQVRATKTSPATTPVERKSPRHQQFLDIARQADVDLLFLGDSITQGWENQPAWKKYFEPLRAANFGISGDQTGHVLWRITQGGELDAIRPRAVVLLIGTNNSGRDSAAQIAEGITLIVQTIRAKLPRTKVLLLGMFPRGEMAGNPLREKLTTANRVIATLDDGGQTVKYMDIGDRFLAKDGSLSREIMPDFLHLSPRGYEIWAEAILPTLQEWLK